MDRVAARVVPQAGALAIVMSLVLMGCSERQPAPISPCTTTDVGRRESLEFVDAVDLLFVIDDSESMAEEQSLLRAEIPRMIRALFDGDLEGDGDLDFVPLGSLHVGIVTSDLGAGSVPAGEVVPSCDPGLGDDGIMRNTSHGFDGCSPSYPRRVFELSADGGTPSAVASDIGCVADLGTQGCGFEQPLEATLKALSPASPQAFVASFYVPPSFHGGASGHGDGANAGFLRADSVLAIVVLSDDEDCSVSAYDMFYPGSPRYEGHPLQLRCERFDEDRYPVERYVAGFAQLREHPSLLVYAAIVGIPVDLAGASYEAMLADDRMQVVETSSDPPSHLPSCDTANGTAYPPRRIIEVARGLRDLGAHTTVQSICATQFTNAVDAIIDEIVGRFEADCLSTPLPQMSDGTVPCEIEELLREGSTCDSVDLAFLSWEPFERPDGSEGLRASCRIPQVTPTEVLDGTWPSGEPGWWYDDVSEAVLRRCAHSPRRIASLNHRPPLGAEVRLRCRLPITPRAGAPRLGASCTPFGPSRPEGICGSLTCDPLTRSCGLTCASDADCMRGGLAGFVCDDRSLLESVGGDPRRVPDWNGDGVVDREDTVRADGTLIPHGYCVHPTCP